MCCLITLQEEKYFSYKNAHRLVIDKGALKHVYSFTDFIFFLGGKVQKVVLHVLYHGHTFIHYISIFIITLGNIGGVMSAVKTQSLSMSPHQFQPYQPPVTNNQ